MKNQLSIKSAEPPIKMEFSFEKKKKVSKNEIKHLLSTRMCKTRAMAINNGMLVAV